MTGTLGGLTGNDERSRDALPNPFVVSENEEASWPEIPVLQTQENSVGHTKNQDRSPHVAAQNTADFSAVNFLAKGKNTLVVEGHNEKFSNDFSQKSVVLQSPFFDLAFQDDKHILDSDFDEVGYDDEVEGPTSGGDSAALQRDNQNALNSPIQNGSSLRGIRLLSAVYNELSKQLGDTVSTAELLLAAQYLIDLSKNDFAGKEQSFPADRAGYYSWDLVRAFSSSHPWHIAEVETARFDHCDVDEYSPETYQNAALIIQGWNERMWEF